MICKLQTEDLEMTSGEISHTSTKTRVNLLLIWQSFSDTMAKISNDFKVLRQPDYSNHCKIVITIDNLKTVATTSKNILNGN